ncbi:MAG TPA: DUF2764 family protein [Lentisphaeria bacterium]|nr:DUF2764 family protein [Lentisphaeria bacterium]
MIGDLFYFLSSLPLLRWGEKPPMSYADFLGKCREALGDGKADWLAKVSLTLDDAPTTALAARWQVKETFLRNVLAEIRASRRRQNAERWLRPTPVLSSGERKRIENAMSQATTWRREEALDHLRWQYLDDLSVGYAFDTTTLEIYAMRLRLLEKQHSRQAEPGREAFAAIVTAGVEQASQPDVRVTEA